MTVYPLVRVLRILGFCNQPTALPRPVIPLRLPSPSSARLLLLLLRPSSPVFILVLALYLTPPCRRWGLTTVLISWDILREEVTRLEELDRAGYDYVLARPVMAKELTKVGPADTWALLT
jgi:hypothetical protein